MRKTVAAGHLPPGVDLTSDHLGGTPTAAGTYTFIIKVTDSAGDQATEPGHRYGAVVEPARRQGRDGNAAQGFGSSIAGRGSAL
jgi:Putative Ig domain